MMHALQEILLGLFIVNLGTAFGAGLYETRIVLPLWFTRTADGFAVNKQAMNELDTGRKFWGMVTTVPLTLLTIANLVMALRSTEPRYDWWLAAALVVLAERIATFAFFIPTALKLMRAETLPPANVSALVSRWSRLNLVRNALTLAGLVLAIRVLALPH
ncbi:MAG: DUF1772 domain-containing protein [Flavobacteriales bacterium]